MRPISSRRVVFELMGLSAQSREEQAEFAVREHIPHRRVSDAALTLRDTLGLPVFEAGGMTLGRRATLLVGDGLIEKVSFLS